MSLLHSHNWDDHGHLGGSGRLEVISHCLGCPKEMRVHVLVRGGRIQIWKHIYQRRATSVDEVIARNRAAALVLLRKLP